MSERNFCVAYSNRREEVEAYLYDGNVIVAETALAHQHLVPFYVIDCSARRGSGFSALQQGARLSSGCIGGGPLTREEAYERVMNAHGVDHEPEPPPVFVDPERFEVYQLRLLSTCASSEAADRAIACHTDDGDEGPYLVLDSKDNSMKLAAYHLWMREKR